MSWATIQDGLRAWLLAATGFADDHVIWADQPGPRPDVPFADLRIVSTVPLGATDETSQNYDPTRDAGQEIEIVVTCVQEVHVAIRVFTGGTIDDAAAFALLGRARLALALPTQRQALADAGITVFDRGEVHNVSALKDTYFEGRAMLDVGCYTLESLSEYTGYFSDVPDEILITIDEPPEFVSLPAPPLPPPAPPPPPPPPPPPQDISDAISSGDQVGNWWTLKANGTMLSGSALTMAGQGSPGVSPLTFDGAAQYFKSAPVVGPAGDFSIVASFNMTGTPGANGYICGKWDSGNLAVVLFVDTSGKVNVAFDDGGGNVVVFGQAAPSPTGTWLAACVTYDSAGQTLTLRTQGVTLTQGTGASGVNPATFPMSVGGGGAGGGLFHGQSRGVFYTEKTLSVPDCDRIMAGVV